MARRNSENKIGAILKNLKKGDKIVAKIEGKDKIVIFMEALNSIEFFRYKNTKDSMSYFIAPIEDIKKSLMSFSS